MNQAHAQRAPQPWWRRVWNTPVGPMLIMGRFKPRPRAATVIAGAELPAELKQAITAVVRRTRLWSSEQKDVAGELVEHFGDALRAGRTPMEALVEFGDQALAARLIQRAKKRNRSVLWHGWVRGWQAMAIALGTTLLVYLALAIRYYTAAPSIKRNFYVELNSEVAAIPEADRAWPLYRQAVLAAPVKAPIFAPGEPYWHDIGPGDEHWPEVAAYLEQIDRTMELTRAAAARPRLAYPLSTSQDDELFAHTLRLWGQEDLQQYIRSEPEPENPPLISVLLPHLSQVRGLSRNLMVDTRRAAAAGESPRVMENVQALLGMSRHMKESPFSISEMVSLAIFAGTMHSIGEVLEKWPEALQREDLVRLAHLVGAHDRARLQVQLTGERMFVMDLLQRMYTDDGNGSGRFTPEGLERLMELDRSQFEKYDLGVTGTTAARASVHLAAPVISTSIASRREVMNEYDRLLGLYREHIARPMWEWEDSVHPGMRENFTSPLWQERLLPLNVLLPGFGTLAEQGERAMQFRDAALGAIALELYRRDAGEYPPSLAGLVPQYLPEVPRDRFDGRPLKYRLQDGRPRLYSVGWDRVDHGGIAPDPDHPGPGIAQFRPRPTSPETAGVDWILWPRPAR